MKSPIFFITLFLLTSNLPSILYAEVYQCNGFWRDKPCDATSSTTTLTASTSDKKAKELSQKRSLIHELAMKAFDTSREYKVRYDISGIENYCLDRDTSLINCQDRVYEMSDRIDQRVASLELIKEQKRANELQQERNEIEANKPPTQINILEENTIILKPSRKNPNYRPGYSSPGYSYKSESYGTSVGINSSTTKTKPNKVYNKPTYRNTPSVTINQTNPIKRTTKPSW